MNVNDVLLLGGERDGTRIEINVNVGYVDLSTLVPDSEETGLPDPSKALYERYRIERLRGIDGQLYYVGVKYLDDFDRIDPIRLLIEGYRGNGS